MLGCADEILDVVALTRLIWDESLHEQIVVVRNPFFTFVQETILEAISLWEVRGLTRSSRKLSCLEKTQI